MNKKIIAVVILLTAASFYFYKNKPETFKQTTKNSGPSAPKAQIQKFIKTLDIQEDKSKSLERLLDFSQDSKSIKYRPKVLNKLIEKTLSCIPIDHCGQGPDEDGYFDPKQTVAQKSLARFFEVIYMENTISISEDLILEAIEIGNVKTKSLGLSLLFKHYPQAYKKALQNITGTEVKTLIKEAKNTLDEADLFTLVKELLEEKEAFVIVEMMESMEENLKEQSKDFYQDLLPSLCLHYPNKSNPKHNWLMIKGPFEKLYPESKGQWQNLCQ